jgi:hypothetical protein
MTNVSGAEVQIPDFPRGLQVLHLVLEHPGLPFCRRWISYWNVFEAILALGSIATIFPPAGSTRASVSRPFGFVRILRVVRYVRGLRTVVSTLGLAGTAMVTILTTIGIVIFAYAGPHRPSCVDHCARQAPSGL